jgi:hypothetical protein
MMAVKRMPPIMSPMVMVVSLFMSG